MSEKTEANDSKAGSAPKLNNLPLQRIRQIMKSSPDVSLVSTEAVFLVRQATELFIKMISEKSYDKQKKFLDYKGIATYVEGNENLEFLHEILPQKITVKEYRKIMEKEKRKENLPSDEDSSESEEEAEEENEEGEEEGDEEQEEEEEDGGSVKSDSSDSVQVIESDKEEEIKYKKRKSGSKESDVIELSSDSTESLKAKKKSK